MAQDVARGTPTEIEQINGEVVRHGRSVDVPTPVNEALLHLVRAQVAQGAWRSAIPDLAAELIAHKGSDLDPVSGNTLLRQARQGTQHQESAT